MVAVSHAKSHARRGTDKAASGVEREASRRDRETERSRSGQGCRWIKWSPSGKRRSRRNRRGSTKRPNLTVSGAEAEIKIARRRNQASAKAFSQQNEKAIAGIIQRINNVPGVEVALGAIERDYQTKKAAYDDLLEQQQKIALVADAASQQQGEGIEVIDPANLPSRPVAPKRLMFRRARTWTWSGFRIAARRGCSKDHACSRFRTRKMPDTTPVCRCSLPCPSC